VQEGTQVGAYRVLQRIGEGGMGTVWLAEHSILGRRAAVKVLHPQYSNSPEIVTRFFNEARAATAIPDPGIVQIFDFGRHIDGSAYIVMELLDGEPLDRRLARHGALGLADTLRIMRQVASTLGAAHARGIVHRDLKPENVFIVRDPEVPGGERAKILDFGIAKLVHERGSVRTHTKAVMGTPPYMSPEQCRGAGQVDQRSDVYALGCVLFTLLVGRPPFNAEGMGDIIAMHLREPPPAPSSLRPGIPLKVDRLVLRCLAKDPAQRFDHGAELATALGNLLASMPQGAALAPIAVSASSSIPTTLSAAASAWGVSGLARTRRAVALVGCGIVVAGGVIAIAVTGGASDPASPQSESTPTSTPASVAPGTRPLARAPRTPPPSAEIAVRMKDVLNRFVAWSRDHRGAPCPDIGGLGDVPRDPWGNAFRLTCVDQPSDQIIGVISAGPDGKPGTADDVASWLLGSDVTDSVHGRRWVTAAPPPSLSSPASAKPVEKIKATETRPAEIKPVVVQPELVKPEAARPAVVKPEAARPAVVKPEVARPAVVKPKTPKPTERIEPMEGALELDEFGLPKKRK
jgi:tRNA A-37 threonylcarbamoyl transferase component Bud32